MESWVWKRIFKFTDFKWLFLSIIFYRTFVVCLLQFHDSKRLICPDKAGALD